MDEPTVDLDAVPPTPPAAPPKAVEVKLLVASALGAVLYAVGTAVQDNTEILDPLPPWARTLILAVLPALLGLGAGYAKASNRV